MLVLVSFLTTRNSCYTDQTGRPCWCWSRFWPQRTAVILTNWQTMLVLVSFLTTRNSCYTDQTGRPCWCWSHSWPRGTWLEAPCNEQLLYLKNWQTMLVLVSFLTTRNMIRSLLKWTAVKLTILADHAGVGLVLDHKELLLQALCLNVLLVAVLHPL